MDHRKRSMHCGFVDCFLGGKLLFFVLHESTKKGVSAFKKKVERKGTGNDQ